MDRAILHCDCNSFFASVETLSAPHLAGVPMAVTGDPENRHGIILAKNELAKAYGVRTAETIYSARQKCPGLVCVPSHMEKYVEISRRINQLYLSYTDLVEPFSIDESYLDLTGSLGILGKTPVEIADELRRRVREELGITISVGVSFCKVFAKLGSDYKKPDATTVFGRTEMESVIWGLPVEDLLFVGRRSSEQLRYLGIHTIGDLAHTDYGEIVRALGEAGRTIWSYANGLDSEPVHSFYERREVKSVSNGMTFRRDIYGREEIHAGIAALCGELAFRLREAGKKCTVVQVTVKDPDFKVIQRQKKIERPTWLLSTVIAAAMDLVGANWKMNAAIRMLTVTLSGLVGADERNEQLSLFGDGGAGAAEEKKEKVEETLLAIRRRMGRESIHLGIYDNDAIGLSNIKKKK